MLITQGEKVATAPLKYALYMVQYWHEFIERYQCQWEQRFWRLG
jgi:hypothetical protein